MPEVLTGLGVERHHVARSAGKDQTRRRRQHTGPGLAGVREFPTPLTGRHVDRAQRAELTFADPLHRTAAKRLARRVVILPREEYAARLARGDEEQAERRIKG